jgi:methionyl-tRNA formyltransferase
LKITVFTSSQPRHLALIEGLAKVADQVFAVLETVTAKPGLVGDFYQKSDVMQEYFSHVIAAEKKIFGEVRPVGADVQTMSVRMGDLNLLDMSALEPMLDSDLYVVFGSSFIKGPLCDFLVEHKAINIHMGVSPYFRGNSCNFWALYDGRPDLVGATIHMLSRGLDSGDILFHALPSMQAENAFDLGMLAVKSAQESLVAAIGKNDIFSSQPVASDHTKELRYTRLKDFTDAIASEYLALAPALDEMENSLKMRDLAMFIRPYIAGL